MADDRGPPSVAQDIGGDRYELMEVIGRGAMGVVYRAHDRVTGRMIALKSALHPDPDDRFRLKREFRSLARLSHPNLVRLHELVADDERCFYTMELVEDALPLTEHVRERIGLPNGAEEDAATRQGRYDSLRATFRQLAGAIQRLHDAEKIHRDLKPNNVLVDATGRVVLLDFGLLGGLGTQLSRASLQTSIVGTLAYMSPEQARGEDLSAGSDWYGYGVLLYECLTGVSPFASLNPIQIFDRDRVDVPAVESVVPNVPADLASLAERLLSGDPRDRPAAAEISAALGRVSETTVEAVQTLEERPARATFVGREGELARLRAGLERMRDGSAAAVSIQGPSGIGKSGLVRHFLDEVELDDALILRSRCYPYQVVPFEALDEAVDELSRFLVAQDVARIEAVAPRDTAALCRVFPVLGRVAFPSTRAATRPEAAPNELRRRAFSALRELLGRLADRQPVIVWIDDLQWSDRDSEPLLRTLLRAPDAPRILWVFSFRSEERGENPLLAHLDGLLEAVAESARHTIELGPLSPEECHRLASALAEEGALPASALEPIAKESGGSPFLVGEMARQSQERTDDVIRDYRVTLARRFDGLSTASRKLLEVVAVAAGPIDRETAIDACAFDDFDPDLVANLEREHLLRTTASEGRVALEFYHDRIRETLAAGLDSELARTRHAEIARALLRLDDADPSVLFTHLGQAGDLAAAARYAMEAGDNASDQLAFDQAAYFYRWILDEAPTAVDSRTTLVRLGDALAHAGRGGEAAVAYGRAAEVMEEDGLPTEAMMLRRQSAEQYLLSGRLDDGFGILEPMAKRLGVHWPTTTGRALRRTLARLPWLAIQYGRFDLDIVRESTPQAELQIDVCQTAAKGLLVVDPIRAAYFSVRALLRAQSSGDVLRTGRALGAVGVALVPVGGIVSFWANRMLRRAIEIGERTGDPYLRAVAAICQAESCFVAGRWGEMLDKCDDGTHLLRASCRGVRWECDVGEMAALRALEELGRIPDLKERLPALLDEAEELDDRYAQVTFSLYEGFWLIAEGATERARQTAEDGLARWDQPVQHLQHLYARRIDAFSLVYEGDPDAAWEIVNETWPAIRAANLLRHPILRTDAFMFRACVALARATAGGDEAKLVGEAERCAKQLARAGRRDSEAGANLIRAGAARLGGETSHCLERLAAADRLYDAAEMPLHALYARRRAAELHAGEEGAARIRHADHALVKRGIREPARWLSVVAPGFPVAH